MIRFLRKLWKDRRGNAIVIAGVALPIVVGGAGLATDTIQWVLWKRELQRAADSAAIAGVMAEAEGTTVESVETAVTKDLNENNNHSGVNLKTSYSYCSNTCDLSFPLSGTGYSKGVQVTIAIQKTLGFSSLFLKTAPTITATATAAMVPGLNPCAIGLAKNTQSVIIDGSTTTNLGCPVMSNSTVCDAVSTGGSVYTFSTPIVAAVGCLPDMSSHGVTAELPHYMSQSDPFSGKFSTTIPSDCTTKKLNQNTYNKTVGGVTQTWLYSYQTNKRCYGGTNGFKFTGGTYYMDPGTYYIDSTDFDTTGGATLIGTGVTLILTGATPGSLQMNGSATIKLSAPTTSCVDAVTGLDPCYKDMLFIQSSSASTNNTNTISGDASSKFDGAFYLPNGQVKFSGNNNATTKCAMVIGYTIEFSGNSDLQNNTTGCTANTTATIQQVKLIA